MAKRNDSKAKSRYLTGMGQKVYGRDFSKRFTAAADKVELHNLPKQEKVRRIIEKLKTNMKEFE